MIERFFPSLVLRLIGLSETKKGHYAIPLFAFGKAEVLMADGGVMMDDEECLLCDMLET